MGSVAKTGLCLISSECPVDHTNGWISADERDDKKGTDLFFRYYLSMLDDFKALYGEKGVRILLDDESLTPDPAARQCLGSGRPLTAKIATFTIEI